MMVKSLLLALFVVALAVLCAWAVVHFGRKHGEPASKLRRIAIAFVLGGLLFGAYTFWADFGQRRVTLFEALLEGTEGSALPALRRADLSFEHAGVEHRLLVLPKPGFGQSAAQAAYATVALRDEQGRPLVEERVVFDLRVARDKYGPGRTVWEDQTWSFTPTRAGPATFEMTLETPGVREILVRVEDPEKTDGERAPGY